VNSIASSKVIISIASLEKWRDITPMKTPRSTGFSFIFKNKIYICGGYTGDKKRSKTIEVYDPLKNYW
jgi:N-acetylneuraminic acid mutarotase